MENNTSGFTSIHLYTKRQFRFIGAYTRYSVTRQSQEIYTSEGYVLMEVQQHFQYCSKTWAV